MRKNQPKKSVLIVDDEKSISSLISVILKNSYKILTAHSSFEAIAKIHDWQPDLITTDINMPGLEGDDLLSIIRGWKPDIPVLVISASRKKRIQEKCIKRGAAGFLSKPFETDDLLNKVNSCMKFQTQLPDFNDIMHGTELAIAVLEKKGLIDRDQVKEEMEKVKSRFNK